MSVSGASVTEATISGLRFSTEYFIEIAAISGGNMIGAYSSIPTIAVTEGKDYGSAISFFYDQVLLFISTRYGCADRCV